MLSFCASIAEGMETQGEEIDDLDFLIIQSWHWKLGQKLLGQMTNLNCCNVLFGVEIHRIKVCQFLTLVIVYFSPTPRMLGI